MSSDKKDKVRCCDCSNSGEILISDGRIGIDCVAFLFVGGTLLDASRAYNPDSNKEELHQDRWGVCQRYVKKVSWGEEDLEVHV